MLSLSPLPEVEGLLLWDRSVLNFGFWEMTYRARITLSTECSLESYLRSKNPAFEKRACNWRWSSPLSRLHWPHHQLRKHRQLPWQQVEIGSSAVILLNASSWKSLHTLIERSSPHKAMKVLVGFDQGDGTIHPADVCGQVSVKTKLQQYINEWIMDHGAHQKSFIQRETCWNIGRGIEHRLNLCRCAWLLTDGVGR